MKLYYSDINDTSISKSLAKLEHLVNTIPALLRQVPDSEFSHKPSPEVWSKKEILGHLIDSATNNHQRFIRIQFEDNPDISYNQDQWNALSGFNEVEPGSIIDYWAIYNRHLIHILKRISSDNLERTGKVRDSEGMTLAWFINDYVEHMEHHLKQIISY